MLVLQERWRCANFLANVNPHLVRVKAVYINRLLPLLEVVIPCLHQGGPLAKHLEIFGGKEYLNISKVVEALFFNRVKNDILYFLQDSMLKEMVNVLMPHS
jgi:hypothetical protein